LILILAETCDRRVNNWDVSIKFEVIPLVVNYSVVRVTMALVVRNELIDLNKLLREVPELKK
jgi:hypothetical protein